MVTAFTLAHSITLSLAALQVISLPSRWVESAIALSVIIAALNKPIWRDGQSFRLGASVGIARSGGCTGPEWLARADQALYAAKAAGRNTFRSFDRYGGASAGPGRRIPPEARIWIG